MKKIFLDDTEIQLILNFLPKAGDEVPEGLCPTFYHTLTYEGDLKIQRAVNDLIEKIT